MSWHFVKDITGALDRKDPTEHTTSSQGALTHLEILVREILQNAVDNRSGNEKAEVLFRVQQLKGRARQKFLAALDWTTLAPHIDGAITVLEANGEVSTLVRPEEFEADDVLTLLFIEDFNTRGLVGPEYNSEVLLDGAAFRKPYCFLGLCRNVGDNQKGDTAVGGTYGFGKSVLWKHSAVRTVLFHSRLVSPYIAAANQPSVDRRLFGHSRLPPHALGRTIHSAPGFFAAEKMDTGPRSFWNTEADQRGEQLGFRVRGRSEHGTSIAIVGMRDPDMDGDDVIDSSSFLRRIRDAAEKFYWPAMIENRLTVRTEDTDGQTVECNPRQQSLVRFQEAYSGLLSESGEAEGVSSTPIVIKVPAGPKPEQQAAQSQLIVGTVLDDSAGDEPLRNHVALIRGSGMVVGYLPVKRKGVNAKDFFAVTLGGRAWPKAVEPFNQDRGEELLARAEPVTHDKWSDKAEPLKPWKGAAARIRDLLSSINSAISALTSDAITPEGDAAPKLAALFPLASGDDTAGARTLRIGIPEIERCLSGGSSFYQFEVRIVVPRRSHYPDRKPTKWRATLHFGPVADNGSSPIERLPIAVTSAKRLEDDNWTQLENDFAPLATFEEKVSNVEEEWLLRGSTLASDRMLEDTRRHLLVVRTFTGSDEQ